MDRSRRTNRRDYPCATDGAAAPPAASLTSPATTSTSDEPVTTGGAITAGYDRPPRSTQAPTSPARHAPSTSHGCTATSAVREGSTRKAAHAPWYAAAAGFHAPKSCAASVASTRSDAPARASTASAVPPEPFESVAARTPASRSAVRAGSTSGYGGISATAPTTAPPDAPTSTAASSASSAKGTLLPAAVSPIPSRSTQVSQRGAEPAGAPSSSSRRSTGARSASVSLTSKRTSSTRVTAARS